jgi:uncharacterized protein (TIGR01777 family)
MKVLIAGGTGFLGSALARSLQQDNHQVIILTRRVPKDPSQIQWDGKTTRGWGHIVNEVDAVVQVTGYGLEHWPWTARQRKRFLDSRVLPGLALASAIKEATHRPRVFLQTSGTNRYGLRGEGTADESTSPGDDFLSQLTIPWEDATKPIEDLGVRRLIARSAVVLSFRGGLFPLMALPVRLFVGGKFGNGNQAVPWIHLADEIGAMRFLLENENAQGAYNMISPEPTSNAEFMKTIAKVLHRPYWFYYPAFLLRLVLGEMSVLITEGRYVQPKRLLELGYPFQFPKLENALVDLLK